jgi:uncharacterized DUF497 family protein
MPTVVGFLFDDHNEEKCAAHGLHPRQLEQVLDGEITLVPNRRGRRGVYLLIGRDHGGTCIAVPIEPTRESGIWRPITAWPCKDHERTLLDHKRS